ncbi:hypothetical protein MKQ70_11945 [Chitinophaga sedimenti]|uniref:ligand-binding sensor domain-containing protein n=1 Tax=Chitinophaga sedimenti TaxID=2033606 RepID=UPI002003E63C|nr:two-component regulator propeller domain-containing protein [Chitinophaga sedimenti]MCK7555687.1 hypothetical protein [Chitinophaga sedimenti]
MPLKALLSCFCLLIVMLQPTAGQEFNYRHYNERDGLVGPVVYSMVQDKEGFIWFATETGVSRFDGTRFRNFTTKDGLPNNEVIRIYCDSKGRVWLMPYKHAICYYQDGYIHTQRNDSLLKKLYLEGFVFCIEENKKGEVMLMDMSNVFLITPDDKVQYLTNMTTTGGAMTKLAVTTADKTWLMYRWSILEYSKGRFREVYKLPYGSVVSGGQVIMDDDLFCYVESSGQYRIHAKKYNLDYLVTSPAINTAERFNDSLILLNTSRGSVLFNILTRRNVTTYLPDKNVSNILRDREGNIWISTLNDGVYRISSDRFQNVLKTTPNNQKISVYGLAKQGGAIHVGTDVGYFRLRPIDGGFEITDDISINMPVTFVDSWRDVLLMCAGLRVFVKKEMRRCGTWWAIMPPSLYR